MYWFTGLIGLALAVAPFVLNYSSNSSAMWSSLILGAVVALLSLLKAMSHDPATWHYWGIGIAGILAALSPFVLNFSAIATAPWVSVILGVAMLVVAGIAVFVPQAQEPQQAR